MQQGHGGDDADGDDQRAGHTHRLQRGNVEGQQRQQTDHDRRAREQHGSSGGGHRPGHGSLDGFTARRFFAEAADDEQRIVDPQAKAEHGGQVEREDRQLEEAAQANHDRQRDRHGRAAHQAWHGAGHQRAKDQHQRHRRGRYRQQLRATQVALGDVEDVLVEDGRTGEGQLQIGARAGCGWPQRAFDGRQDVAHVVRGGVQRQRRVLRPTVRRDLAQIFPGRHHALDRRQRAHVDQRVLDRLGEARVVGRQRAARVLVDQEQVGRIRSESVAEHLRGPHRFEVRTGKPASAQRPEHPRRNRHRREQHQPPDRQNQPSVAIQQEPEPEQHRRRSFPNRTRRDSRACFSPHASRDFSKEGLRPDDARAAASAGPLDCD
jgi:hypothetical protein